MSALIILWSAVQVREGPPVVQKPTFGLAFYLITVKSAHLEPYNQGVNQKLSDHLQYQTQANQSLLKDWLIETNERTRNILVNLKPGQELVPTLEILNPPHWEFGHLTWFHEFWVHRKGQISKPSLLSNADLFFNSSEIAHTDRWTIEMPSLKSLLQYNLEVFQKTLELLQGTVDSETEYFIQLSIFHQDMHNEAFAYMWQTLAYAKPFERFSINSSKGNLKSGYLRFPKSTVQAGSEKHSGFIFDNEKWAHPVEVDDFSIASRAVTNGEYLEFIEATQSHSDGERIEIPKYWKKEGSDWCQRFFDDWQLLALDEPVRHVSYVDAQRYCEWRQVRLPTEHELSLLMSQVDGQRQASNLWEWTSSPFMPFPEFSADPYVDYSQPWFDGNYQVLKGWSPYTPERLRRVAFRNFYSPKRSDHFCGFRTCLL
jgi:gamma-glutamyl hercynylcysteine S-oxide synthase